MHKITISVLGIKGGAAKTTTTHLLSLGLAKFSTRAILLTTDHTTGRLSLSDVNRPYKTRSGQTSQNLKKWFENFQNVDVSKHPAALVIDGGGNRQNVDDVLANYSDLILLPFRDSEEDIRVVSEDMRRLPTAYALPSAWPTNNFANVAADKVLKKMEAEFPGRILKPVPVCRATQQLLREEFAGVDSTVTSIAKSLTFDVLSKLDINPFTFKFQ